MIHNKNFVPILLSIVSATTGIYLSKQAVSTNASSSNWGILAGQGVTLEDVEVAQKSKMLLALESVLITMIN